MKRRQKALPMTKIHARTCHICEANCGVLMTIEEGKVTKVTGNPDHVLSEGYICPKATAIPDIQNDPDRLRKPIKKVGDGWEEISWEQAFSEIAAKHQKTVAGPKIAAMFLGNPNAHNYSSSFSMRGLTKAWLNCHLPLMVPKGSGRCEMRVGDTMTRWQEGRWLIFDETVEHEVWNESDEVRIVLFLQVRRPMTRIGNWAASLLFRIIRRTGFVRDANKAITASRQPD